MNILKNMEAIFVVAVILAGASTYASAAIPAARALHSAQAAVRGEVKIPVVHVTAKRLTAAEKAQSL